VGSRRSRVFPSTGITSVSRSSTLDIAQLLDDYNYVNAPVPQGFTADWFGWLQPRESTDNLTFEPAALSGDVYSSTWVANTHYYLYVYITETGQLLESYETQGFNPKKGTVIFDSPFENGFVIPVNMTISLEIVHPSD
jgi:hypothetical protein